MSTEDSLPVLMAGSPGWTLAVAESLTVGRVQARIGATSGSSAYFLGGLTAYSRAQKVRHLGVDDAMAAACDSVSAEVAAQMACGVRRLFGADWGVATTGYAESAPQAGIARPYAWIAVTGPGYPEPVCERVLGPEGAGRAATQSHIADAAVSLLTRLLRIARASA